MFDTSHLHPMIVHFPIALTLLGILVALVESFSRQEKVTHFGEYLLYLSTMAAVVSIATGEFFTGTFLGKPLEIRDIHRAMAYITTCLLIIACAFYLIGRMVHSQQKHYRRIGLTFYALSAIAMMITGAVGGNLVYNYLIGL